MYPTKNACRPISPDFPRSFLPAVPGVAYQAGKRCLLATVTGERFDLSATPERGIAGFRKGEPEAAFLIVKGVTGGFVTVWRGLHTEADLEEPLTPEEVAGLPRLFALDNGSWLVAHPSGIAPEPKAPVSINGFQLTF